MVSVESVFEVMGKVGGWSEVEKWLVSCWCVGGGKSMGLRELGGKERVICGKIS